MPSGKSAPRPRAGQAGSARRRTGSQTDRPDWQRRSAGSCARASEGLAQADIDAERRIALAAIERHADIDPYRAEVGVVAHTKAGADARREQREVRDEIGIGAAGVDEGHRPPRLAEALAEFD